MNKDIDILAELETSANTEEFQDMSVVSEIQETEIQENNHTPQITIIEEESQEKGIQTEWEKSTFKKILWNCKFIAQYSFTSLLIFWVLMIWVNYNAYYQLFQAYFYAEQMEENKKSMIESVSAAASVVREEKNIWENIDLSFITRSAEAKELSIEERHSPNRLLAKASKEDIQLDISITPYENRVVIPKIGKNIPLVEVKNREVESVNELHDIFMQELEDGIVRYPGSALPGEAGNSFIFGHSSNFPWLPGNYNEVFALLDRLEKDDEVIIYYNQKKYVYVVREKTVVKPWDTRILRDQNKDKKLITLMTCWPVGTTTNRLLVIGELVEVK